MLGRAKYRMLAKPVFVFWCLFFFCLRNSRGFAASSRFTCLDASAGFRPDANQSPNQRRGRGLGGPAAAGGPCRRWERAVSGGQLGAASGYKGEGMKPPGPSSDGALNKRDDCWKRGRGPERNRRMARWRRPGGAFWCGWIMENSI